MAAILHHKIIPPDIQLARSGTIALSLILIMLIVPAFVRSTSQAYLCNKEIVTILNDANILEDSSILEAGQRRLPYLQQSLLGAHCGIR